MRLLHTSDWHVGKSLRGRSRLDEHSAVLAEIVGIAGERQVDAVLVTGDVFDTSAPPPDAEELVYRTLLDLARTGADVVVLSGNHDNPRRLRAVAPVFRPSRVHVVTQVRRPDDGGLLRLRDGALTVVPVPFVSHRGIVGVEEIMRTDPDERGGKYAERIERLLATLCADLPGDAVNVIAAHLMVTGGSRGGGERESHIFEYDVPARAFPLDAHYVALGHLHRGQELPTASPSRYAGSPLMLDFGESHDPGVVVVEAAPGAPATVEVVPLSEGRRLRTLVGDLETLKALAGEVGDEYLRVFVREKVRHGLADEVRALLPHAVDVRIDRDAAGGGERGERPQRAGRSPLELFDAFCEEKGVDDSDVRALFVELLEEVG